MPDWKTALASTPDISFIDGRTIEDVKSEMVADYEAFMTAAEGKPYTLDRAAPHRMELYAAAAQIYQAMQYIDRGGKVNLLKYSYGGFLDNLALIKGPTRNPAAAASTTVRFTLSATRAFVVSIPAGTRVSMDGSVYFATDVYTEIPAGSLTADVTATCTTPGTAGNGYQPGELATLVDPVPYVAQVANVTPTAGGTDAESDDDYKERIYLAPGAYSTAGPEDAYRYHAMSYSAAVGDVETESSQAAGTVDLVFVLADGSDPGPEMIQGMLDHLSARLRRPMTDLVHVSAPQKVAYTIDVTYWINRSQAAQAVAIQQAVTQAVEDYKTWQRTIGRDINPSKLHELMMKAGAKRLEITAPVYTAVSKIKIAALEGDAVVRYGGLEDD